MTDDQIEIIELNLLMGEGLSNQDGLYLMNCLAEMQLECDRAYEFMTTELKKRQVKEGLNERT